jgi:hypothetical protein
MLAQAAEIEFHTFDGNGSGTGYRLDGAGTGKSFDLTITSNGNSIVYSFSETADLDGGTVDDTLSFDMVQTVYTGSTYNATDVTLGSSVQASPNMHFGQGYDGDLNANVFYPGDSFTLEIQNIIYTDGEGDANIEFTGFNSLKKYGGATHDLLLGTTGYTSLTVGGTGSTVDLGGVDDVVLTTSITSGTSGQRLRDLNFTFETVRFLWENDMSADPVGDGWVERNTTSNYTVNAGVLTMTNSTLLDSVPYNELKGVTKADLVWRSITDDTSGNGWGSFLWFNIDSDAPGTYPVHFDSIKTNDSQTVKIFSAVGNTVLASHEGFSTNMLTLSATLNGFNKTADYIITDGTLSVTNSVDLVGNTASGGNPVTLGTKAPIGEVDYVRIEANVRPGEAALVAEGDIALQLVNPATTVAGSVELGYGTVSGDMEITAITVSDESHGVGSFNVLTSPQTLASAAYATLDLEVQFDNSVAGLPYGSATGLVTVTWTETGTGVTNDTVVALSAAYNPVDLPVTWNGGGNVVNWGDADNWSLDRVPGVYAADSGVIDNGDAVTVATNFTGAYAYDVAAQNGSTLNIAADLQNIDVMDVGSVAAATVNQTAGAVDSAELNISVADNTESPVYNLTGGSHGVSGNMTIETNGVLNVDGGALTVDQFLYVNDGALLSLSGGAVTTGVARASNENNLVVRAGGTIEISGGTFRHNSRFQLSSGGTVRFIGSGAGMSVNQLQSYNGTHKFVLDEAGVGSMECRSWGKLGGCTFEIDGSAYTGGPADIVLFSSAYHATANTPLGAYTVTGLGVETNDWTITEVNDSALGRTITLSILGPAPIGPITPGGTDGNGDFVFSWDTVDGQAYNVETNSDLMFPNWGVLDTIIGDGAAVSFTNTPDQAQLFYKITSE